MSIVQPFENEKNEYQIDQEKRIKKLYIKLKSFGLHEDEIIKRIMQCEYTTEENTKEILNEIFGNK